MDNFEPEKKAILPLKGVGMKIICSLESKYLIVAGECSYIFVFDLTKNNLEFDTINVPNGCHTVKKIKSLPNN